MKDLSFHITDILQNSIRANATSVTLEVTEQNDWIRIRIADNGCGMDADTIARVSNPFYTTRTTRKVGLGIPFLIQNAEQTGGEVQIHSVLGNGTEVIASFCATHIDCPPWGDLSGTLAMAFTCTPEIGLTICYTSAGEPLELSTAQVLEILDGIPLNHPKVMLMLKEMIGNHISDSLNTKENA